MEALAGFLRPGLRALTETGALREGAERPATPPDGPLLVVDLEMSGPNPREHEVIDVGGVRAALAPGFPEEEAWGSRVRPLHIGTANPASLKVAGYAPRDWRDAIGLEEAFAGLAELGRGATIAGWGIPGDMAFLAETARRTGVAWPFAETALDIQRIARKRLGAGEVERFNLGHVADRLGIGRMGEHGALADACAAYDVLVALAERAGLGAP